jgi:6-pyruvoyltetrahydropterin/6-carboxytetrahydropterin synthase
MIRLTKRVEFCAAHRYFNPRWTEEKNRRVFGKEANPNGHGHNYILEVTIQGEPSPETGMVMDLKTLKDLIVETVVDRFDHKHLNRDVPYSRKRSRLRRIWRWSSGSCHGRLEGCRLDRSACMRTVLLRGVCRERDAQG